MKDVGRLNKLTQADRAFLQELFVVNYKIINVTVYNSLGEKYKLFVEDVVAQVYLLACEKVCVLRDHSNPKAWLITAAKLVSLETLRKCAKIQKVASIDECDGLCADGDVLEDIIYSSWVEDNAVQKLLSSLTKREKQVYDKLYKENKTAKQSAAELGVTTNLVHNMNKRLKDKIVKAIIKNRF